MNEVLSAARALAQQREKVAAYFHDILEVDPAGHQVLEAIVAHVEKTPVDPAMTNPNEHLWYLQGHRALVQWIQQQINFGLMVKSGVSPFRGAQDMEGNE